MSILPSRSFGEIICCDCSKKTSKNSPNKIRCLSCANKAKTISKEIVKKECPACNLVFESINKLQVYCNDSCRRIHNTKMSNEKWMTKKKKGSGQKKWVHYQ
jgi:hypothetical protein